MDYKGGKVPCMVRFSKKGSIDGIILRDILARIDELDLMERKLYPNITPFFLCDAHSSRFDIEFLIYILSEKTKWKGCFGVPNGTAKWQVHDAEECNGSFKGALARAKRNFVKEKDFRFGDCLNSQIETYEVMPILDEPFRQAFCQVMIISLEYMSQYIVA